DVARTLRRRGKRSSNDARRPHRGITPRVRRNWNTGRQIDLFSVGRRRLWEPAVFCWRVYTEPRKPLANFLPWYSCQTAATSPSIRFVSRPAELVMAGHRFLNQCRMNGGSTRTRIRCAMLRHAEMPKGSRRVPNVYRRVHSRPRAHGPVGRLFHLLPNAATLLLLD